MKRITGGRRTSQNCSDASRFSCAHSSSITGNQVQDLHLVYKVQPAETDTLIARSSPALIELGKGGGQGEGINTGMKPSHAAFAFINTTPLFVSYVFISTVCPCSGSTHSKTQSSPRLSFSHLLRLSSSSASQLRTGKEQKGLQDSRGLRKGG